MRKINYIAEGALLLLLAASMTLNVKFIYQDICRNSQDIEDEGNTSKSQTIADESKDVTVLRGNLSASWFPETPMEGWFIEHIKEKLGIDILQADYPVSCGNFMGCEKGVDLCYFNSSEDYYNRVREGKLKNLEDDLTKKWPQIYQRYRTPIDRMRADTYKHTGKKGIYGIPALLHSFNETWKEGYCLTIPTGASHPEQAMEFIMYSASDEGIMDIAFGPEGQMWEKKDGRYVLLQNWRELPDGKAARKFVVTKDGMEDFSTAVCKLELVGNENLGLELLAMSSANKIEELAEK